MIENRVSNYLKSILNKIALLVISYFILSCGGGAQNDAGELTITVGQATRFLIPAKTFSCLSHIKGTDIPGGQDIASTYFELPPTKFNWNSTTHKLSIIAIFLSLKSSILTGNKYECMITGLDLAASVYYWHRTSSTGVSDLREMNPNDKVNFPVEVSTAPAEGGCNFICGGLSTTGLGLISGRMKVLAVATSFSDGTEVPFTTEDSFSLQNIVQPPKP